MPGMLSSLFVSVYTHSVQYLPKTWLDFTNENIKILGNKIEFKAELKKYLLSELSSIISCDRLLCPSCHLNAEKIKIKSTMFFSDLEGFQFTLFVFVSFICKSIYFHALILILFYLSAYRTSATQPHCTTKL